MVYTRNKILYFHGLGRGEHTSFYRLKDLYAQYDKNAEWLMYDFDYLAENPIEIMPDNKINTSNVVIGNSFGGFFALYYALKYRINLVLINPSITPTAVLKREDVESGMYQKYEKELDRLLNKENNLENSDIIKRVFIGKYDDVVDSSIIQSRLRLKEDELILTDWGHRIPEGEIEKIVEVVKEVFYETNSLC